MSEYYYNSVAREQDDLSREDEIPLVRKLSRLKRQKGRIVLDQPKSWDAIERMFYAKTVEKNSFGPMARDYNNRKQKGPITAKRVEKNLKAALKAKQRGNLHVIPRYLKAAKLSHNIIDELGKDMPEVAELNAEIIEIENRLVRSALKLTYKIASSYFYKQTYYDMQLEDLIAQANLALVRAVKNYDPEYGGNGKHIRFITYAYWFILAKVKEWASENNRFIRLPKEKLRKLTDISRLLAPDGDLSEAVARYNETIAESEQIDEQAANVLVSMRNPMRNLTSKVIPPNQGGIDFIEQQEAGTAIRKAIRLCVNPVERRILELKFFHEIDSYQELLNQLKAEGFLLTMDTLRDAESRALHKLKLNPTIQELRNESLEADRRI